MKSEILKTKMREYLEDGCPHGTLVDIVIFARQALEESERELAQATTNCEQISSRLVVAESEIARLREELSSPKCHCEESTGWTEIRCCNICGLPHKDETIGWRFNLSNVAFTESQPEDKQ